MARKLPKKLTAWAAVLMTFDPKYFTYGDGERQPKNLDEAAYDVATWFFDNTKQSSLKRMLTRLPEQLWTKALENWRDHHHDT